MKPQNEPSFCSTSEACLGFIAFSRRTWGSRRGSEGPESNRRDDSHHDLSLQGPTRLRLPPAETLQSWIEVAAGRGFLSFITELKIEGKKSQVKHVCIGFEQR